QVLGLFGQLVRAEAPHGRPPLHRQGLGRRPLDPWLLRRLLPARRPCRLLRCRPRERRPPALGRHRDRDRVERLHGRRDPIRLPGGPGSAGAAPTAPARPWGALPAAAIAPAPPPPAPRAPPPLP